MPVDGESGGTQRYQRTQRDDEDEPTQAIIALASEYDRFGQAIRTGIDSGTLDPNNPNTRWFNHGSNSPLAIPGQCESGNAAL